MGTPGAVGADGAPGALGAPGAPGATMAGIGETAPQLGHFVAPASTSAPHFGQFDEPFAATGGLKHITYPFLGSKPPPQQRRLSKRIRKEAEPFMTSSRPKTRVSKEGKARDYPPCHPSRRHAGERAPPPLVGRLAAYSLKASSRVPTPNLL